MRPGARRAAGHGHQRRRAARRDHRPGGRPAGAARPVAGRGDHARRKPGVRRGGQRGGGLRPRDGPGCADSNPTHPRGAVRGPHPGPRRPRRWGSRSPRAARASTRPPAGGSSCSTPGRWPSATAWACTARRARSRSRGEGTLAAVVLTERPRRDGGRRRSQAPAAREGQGRGRRRLRCRARAPGSAPRGACTWCARAPASPRSTRCASGTGVGGAVAASPDGLTLAVGAAHGGDAGRARRRRHRIACGASARVAAPGRRAGRPTACASTTPTAAARRSRS